MTPPLDSRSATARAFLAALLLACPLAALAHTDAGDVGGGFIAGFLHPLGGLDHAVAMVAVGIWGAQLRQPAIWMLPIAFPLMMTIGGVLGASGVGLPGVEIGIAASAIVLGALIVAAARPPLWVALLVVGAFAIFHGHAHGAELPASANAMAYSAGFVVSTGLLHVTGIVIGEIRRVTVGSTLLRGGGALIALVGVWFLLPLLSGG